MEKGKDIGQSIEIRQIKSKSNFTQLQDFVLEKSIFNNVFEKDIRRVFIYKKAERLAKAIHLITPAFSDTVSLKNRIDTIAIGLVDAATLPSSTARAALSRELLTLSSILSIAQSSGLLSSMNAELIARETHLLLQEVSEYEEPRVSFDETPTLSGIAKKAFSTESPQKPPAHKQLTQIVRSAETRTTVRKGHIKDISNPSDIHIKDRTEAVLSVIRNRGVASIKDISTIIRDVSEKTIQRELMALVAAGTINKQGERRWSTYSLV